MPGATGPESLAPTQERGKAAYQPINPQTQQTAKTTHTKAISNLGISEGAGYNSDIPKCSISPPNDESRTHLPRPELVGNALDGICLEKDGLLSDGPSARRASLSDIVVNFDETEGKHDISNKAWAGSATAASASTGVSKLVKSGRGAAASDGLGSAAVVLDSLAGAAGTAATGISLFKKIKLNNEIKRMEKQLKTETDPDKKADMERAINEKRSQIGPSAKSLGFSLLANVCWNVSSAVGTAAKFGAKIGSSVANAVTAAFGGIAYGVISAGVKIAGIVKDFKEIRSINKEIKMCNDKLNDPKVSNELKEIYGARKLTLETKVKENVKLNRMKNFVDLGCSVISVAQGLLALTFAAAAPWLAIPLAVGLGASVGIKIYMDKKAAKADQKIDQALKQSVADADFNHKGPGSVQGAFSEQLGRVPTKLEALIPRPTTNQLAANALENEDAGIGELKGLVAKEMGISDPSKVTANDIEAWTRKAPAPSGATADQGAPLLA